MNAPVELPTTRQSRHFHQVANIHDPNWIPVLHKTSPQSQTSTSYFDAGPRFPSRGSSRPTTPRDGGAQTKDSVRTFPQELEAGPISNSRSRQGSNEPHNRQRSRETEDTLTSSGDDTILSADAPSTAGTGSLLEHQTYVLPRSALKESKSFTTMTSDRASIISNSRRPAVPTSRYNRKPGIAGSLPTSPTATSPVLSQYRADSPRSFALDVAQGRKMSTPSLHDLSLQQAKPTSPISLYTTTHSQEPKRTPQPIISPTTTSRPPPPVQELSGESSRSALQRSETAVELPTTALPQLPPEPPSYEVSNNKNRKSTSSIRTTVSVRKKRALHSHPSNPSLRSEKMGSTAETAVSQAPSSSSTTLRRTRTNESRRSVVTDADPPTIAPSGPLPELPQIVQPKRPSTKHKMHKTSEGNLSLFPQQSSITQTSALTNSPPKPDPVQSKQVPKLYYSPSSFSITNTTTDASVDSQQVQHHHNKSEANSIPHKELADFMTSKSTLIFRRFDEMHVKLLLSIQDEIATLESELIALEAASERQRGSDESEDDEEDDENDFNRENQNSYQEKGDVLRRKSTKRDRPRSSKGVKESTESRGMKREKRKIKIMADLRRLLAEYDHLHSNWALMQKSPATLRDRRDLERYLSGDIGTSESARSDLLWTERNAGDLSCITVGNVSSTAETSRPGSRSRASSWSKSKGRLAAKGLGLKMRSESLSATNTNNHGNGIGNADSFDEKAFSGTRDNRKGSIFSSWFSSCAGRRK